MGTFAVRAFSSTSRIGSTTLRRPSLRRELHNHSTRLRSPGQSLWRDNLFLLDPMPTKPSEPEPPLLSPAPRFVFSPQVLLSQVLFTPGNLVVARKERAAIRRLARRFRKQVRHHLAGTIAPGPGAGWPISESLLTRWSAFVPTYDSVTTMFEGNSCSTVKFHCCTRPKSQSLFV